MGAPDPKTVRAFLALGSNLGDRRAHLRTAVESLEGVVAVSGVYETDPVGGPAQGPYLNCVVELETTLEAEDLLDLCQSLERAAQRRRSVRWGPRTLDVDVLLYGEAVIDTPRLTVPHPRMWERRFVLEPLADLAPELIDVDWRSLDAGGVRRVEDL